MGNAGSLPPRASRTNPARGVRDPLGFERLVFFSDAVFAIAITLLVIEIRLPDALRIVDDRELVDALVTILPGYVSYIVSFVVIGSLWLKHHDMYRMIGGYDARLLVLNLLFLLFVAFLPFPTGILGRYPALPIAEAFYALWVAAAGFAKLAMWRYASRRKWLLERGVRREEIARATVRYAIPAVVFLVSAPLAWVHWLAPIVAWCLAPLASMALRHRFGAGDRFFPRPSRQRRTPAGGLQ